MNNFQKKIEKDIEEDANRPTQLLECADQEFQPTPTHKNQRAEFYTPDVLRIEMLDSLPISFWKTPKKVFEPACGKGWFVLKIVKKFKDNLTIQFKTHKEKLQYIIENCIYFADISKTNIELVQKKLKTLCYKNFQKIQPNYYIGDATQLEVKDIQNIFDISKGFDAVITNPPYNHPSKNTGNTLWETFIKMSLHKWTVYGGYFVCVHPAGWRKPTYTGKERNVGLFQLMAHDNTMIYLSMNDSKEGQRKFHCFTQFDLYCIRKQYTRTYKTKIKDFDGNIYTENLKQWSWYPSCKVNEIKKLLAKENNEKCPIIYSRTLYAHDKPSVKDYSFSSYTLPLVHATPKTGEVRYKYTSKNVGHFGIKKVIFSETGFTNPVKDLKGKYGMTDAAMAIQVKNKKEADKVIQALTSKKFKNLKYCVSWYDLILDWRIFTHFKRTWYNHFL